MTEVLGRWSPYVFALALAVAASVPATAAAGPPLPHAGVASVAPSTTGRVPPPYQLWPVEAVSADGMVVSGSEAASKAGAAVLGAGGNAVDAAVATAFALGVTEPGTSGLGAEALILIYRADGRTVAIDGSCYVPTLARGDELLRARASADRHYIQDYRAAAVPGSLAALAYAVDRYGTRSLADVLAPAIDLAEFGFTLNTTGFSEFANLNRFLRHQEYVADLFLRDFTDTWGPGHVFCNSDLARTLRRTAESGAGEFYRGGIADEIDADMARNGGYIRKADLTVVRAVERQPLRSSYHGVEVVTFPYPGGGASLLEVLHILETFPPALLRGDSLDRLHLLLEAERIALADSQDSKLPLPLLDHRLSDRRWAAQRAALIRFDRALSAGEVGEEAPEPYITPGTTQVSVIDRWGNVVGLAQTLGGFFGATVATPGLGFLYNSNLNAFNYTSPLNPHHLAPGAVPMTALTPTIVLRDGKPVLVLGSAGSDRVVPSIVAVISGAIDRRLDVCDAVAAPRALWGSNWSEPRAFLEVGGEITAGHADALEARGFPGMYRLTFPAAWFDLLVFGGSNAVAVDLGTGMLMGVPDPRRSGFAASPGMR